MDKEEILLGLHIISEKLLNPETMHIGFFNMGLLIAKLEFGEGELDDNDHC